MVLWQVLPRTTWISAKLIQPCASSIAPNDSACCSAAMLPPAVVCAEDIALLHVLHSVPLLPSSNEIKSSCHREGYSLSLKQERTLVSTLAFLSSTRDDTDHVPALCLQENPETASLSIILAVNRANWEDGSHVLRNLKTSLEQIFGTLFEASKERGQSRAREHRVFTAIVSVCSHRILRRLRFATRKWGSSRQALKSVLGNALDSLEQVKPQALHSLPVGLFTERAKEVIRLIDLWAKHQTGEELESLVEGIYRLKQIERLQALLDSIPNRAMDPSSRKNLFNIVSKVSRYREAARFLYRTARKTPLLGKTNVVMVNLPREAFDRVAPNGYSPQLSSAITRVSKIYQSSDINYICRVLKSSTPQLSDQFADQTRKTLREAKIHAEVQLVIHLELHPSKLPPRVICSSKDACFLCNAFILVHGKMHVPRTHGRLYAGWRLPLMPNLVDLQLRFNSVLEHQIQESLKLLFSRKKKTVYPNPNESTLLTLLLSTSTLRAASVVAQKNEPKTPRVGKKSKNDTAGAWDRPGSSKSQNPIPIQHDQGEALSVSNSNIDLTAENTVSEIGLSHQSAIQLSSLCDPSTAQHRLQQSDSPALIQGVSRKCSIPKSCRTDFYIAGIFEIHIECEAGGQVPGAPTQGPGMAYSIEWLSTEQTRELLLQSSDAIVDVEALPCRTSQKVEHHGELLIMARGVLARILPQKAEDSIGSQN
ncbi:hypothetical protein OPT61_g7190 [Boeremia exigua]|uniref:Uncharacterized protein n=1 Tax=Boeremia exigua TaxID=749465 RepID=A0ACC2I478_9PLEO|nr:hypothetical protein OPT61_g7190 [Boeremia exigua]